MATQTITQRRPTAQLAPSSTPSPPFSKPFTALRPDGRGFPCLYPPTPSATPLPSYTWEQVASHCSADSCWVYSGSSVYDITEWLDRHPGGRDALLLCAGRDVTDLLPSYHPFTDSPQLVLAKYRIGHLQTSEFPQYRPDSGFYRDVRTEVARYFKDSGLNSKAPLPGLLRLAGMAVVAALAFAALIAWGGTLPLPLRVVAAVVFGVCQALPLLHCMHDASHLAIGRSPGWWYWVGRLTMDWFAGASIASWHHQHILGHHVYTNVMGVDPDLPATREGDIRRVCEKQTWAAVYAWQHVYLCVLYGALALKFRIQDLTGTLWAGENGMIRVNDPGLGEKVGQLVTKACWVGWRWVLPLVYAGVEWRQFVALSLLAELVTGWYLTFNFQVSHVSVGVAFPDGEVAGFGEEWGAAQLQTTVDYAHGDAVATFLCGALNYQSVHHLFPCVSQYHYPALAPIVKRVAEKWGVRYNYVGSFGTAVGLHIEHLRLMGVKALHEH